MTPDIDARFDDQIGFLKSLIRIPSSNPPGKCAKVSESVAKLLEKQGFEVARLPVPKPFVHQYGMRSTANLLVRKTFGEGTGPTVVLQAHGDAVPPGDGWSEDPFGGHKRGGAIYGRGAADAKCDIATYTFALLALIDAAAEGLNGAVELHVTFDGEVGGALGPSWILGQGLSKPDFAISSGITHVVTTAHNGCLHLEIVVRGRQAHAAIPETGVDALAAATPILTALYAERDRLSGIRSAEPGIGTAKLTVGMITGGISFNVVPDRVVLQLDRRLIPEEDGEAVEAGLIELVTEATPALEGLDVECRRKMLAEPLCPAPETLPLAQLVQENAGAVLGSDVPITGVPLYTDARHYAAAGIPTVLYGAGPKDIREMSAHSADEHIALDDLHAATAVVARTLADILSGTLSTGEGA
ncbi:acetylornithine deacetylase/succinyl-diaminopimelate desuccinylase-like protein [Rhodobium orientis]|uniref:Peptidase M20 n=1 Tax=Rhodobium orientis TaxID=34017 RepID=A0A327JU11_9HYPH|nr:M20/M25/M40 family metallo-hydrolase [Rhodobium orientis]MBB4302268.1 acetylornithine deacetylase/succinyl-diaminopimelate desuccinylase-like protein [Rhodobium orientis]MBK5948978.1 peptidase M20 [Rhodobium orientis]RAI28974.1 peptidase M20 [Rhodobium orientis]